MSEAIEVVDGTRLVTLRGELDAHDAPRLRTLFAEALAEAPPGTRIVLDLGQVSFLDSTALGSIIGLLRRVRERDGELRVVLPCGTAVRIFEITGLDAILASYPSRAAALER